MNLPETGWADVDRSAHPERLVSGLDRLRADPFFAARKQAMLDALELRGDERIVDVGCGTGDDTADLGRTGALAIGVERSLTMLDEARRRHTGPRFVAADARNLPLADGSVQRVRVDRVLQHLTRPLEGVAEWRRVLGPGGMLVVFEPDLLTARIEGMDPAAAERVVAWRATTRPGADAVHSLTDVLTRAGFARSRIESSILSLDDLGRADTMMGLPDWGAAAGAAGVLERLEAERWSEDARAAGKRGSLRYSCSYVLGSAWQAGVSGS